MKLLGEMVEMINKHIQNEEIADKIATELLDLIRTKDIDALIE